MTTNPIRDAIATAELVQALEPFGSGVRRRTLGDAWTDMLLAVRLAHLCPDCHGSGTLKHAATVVDPADIDANGRLIPVPCSHPNAPTVGRLIAIGQRVFEVQPYNSWLDDLGRGYAQGRNDLLAALREVDE